MLENRVYSETKGHRANLMRSLCSQCILKGLGFTIIERVFKISFYCNYTLLNMWFLPHANINILSLKKPHTRQKGQFNFFLFYFILFYFLLLSWVVFFFKFLLGIFLIYISNAIPKVEYTQPQLPYSPTPPFWPWNSPVLGHIKFASPI